MRPLFWVTFSLGTSLVLAGCSGVVDKAGGKPARRKPTPTVLSLALRADPWEVSGFADEVSRLSHGTLRITIKPRWRYGEAAYAPGLIRDVRAGRADLGAAEAGAWDSVGVTSLRALGAPLLIDSYALQKRVLESSMIPEMLRRLRPLGLVGLGVLPGQLPRLLGVSRPLLDRSDYAGGRIGVQQSPVGDATVRALGATPDWVRGGGAIAGLAGIAEPISWISGSRYDRVARYLTTNVVLWARPLVLFANSTTFAGLTRTQQRILEQAAKDDVTGQTNVVEDAERYDANVLCAHRRLRFLAATPADVAALRQALRPVYQRLERNPQTRRFVRRIEDLRARLGAQRHPSALPTCGRARPFTAPGAATLLDGVYRLTIEKEDLTPAERLPEAYGSWQIVLDRGRFRFTQRSDHADWIADGSMRIRGHEMWWTVADAGPVGPHGALDGVPLSPGATIRFGWRRVGKTLTLVSGARPALVALAARPAQRIADAPGQQPLENPAEIQGTWASNPTAADVIAHHGDPGGIAENTGPLRLAVRGDRCRWTQHAPAGNDSGVGICRFAGDTLEFDKTPTDDPSSIPMFLRWSVYHNRLTFSEAPGLSPESWTFHPWRKVG